MRTGVALALGLSLVACKKAENSTPDNGAAPAAADSAWVVIDAKQPLEPQLAAQATAALKAGHKPTAYLHAEWCPPCKAIDKTRLTDASMKAAFAPAHIISIDIDAADPKQLEALKLGAEAIPAFYRLDASGHVTGDKIDGGAWGDNIPENMAPPLTAFFAKP